VLKQYKGRKVVVLGDMLELGVHSEASHRGLAEFLLDASISALFTIGPEMSVLQDTDLPVQHFRQKVALNKAVLNELKAGDVLLVKGSRGLQLEDTVAFVKDHWK
jgi:UDP-N-acetylmuramoyl-tripeptide--D-alanyl-D-alanine ligase